MRRPGHIFLFSIISSFIFNCLATDACAAWTSTVSGTAAVMIGTSGDDLLSISVAGVWMAHGRFTAGDPGFVSDIDFDSTVAGEQRIPDDGSGALDLNGVSGFDSLGVRDGFFVNPNNHLQVRTFSIELGGEPGGNRPHIAYFNFDRVTVSPQNSGNGGVEIISTLAGTTYNLSSAKDQFYTIGDPVTKSLDSIQGPITTENGGNFDLIDSDDTTDNIYTVDNFNKITRTGSADLDLFLTNSIRLFAGKGHNTYLVRGNSTPDFQLNGGNSTNDFIFGSTSGKLDTFREPVQLNRFGGGSDSVVYNETTATQSHDYSLISGSLVRDFGIISQGSVPRVTLNCSPLNDTIWAEPGPETVINAGPAGAADVLVYNLGFYSGDTTIDGGLSYVFNQAAQSFSFTGIDHLFVYGGNSPDHFTVFPSPEMAITVDGGGPETSPGDLMTLVARGERFKLNGNIYTVNGSKPVTFSGFESTETAEALQGVDLSGQWNTATVVARPNNRFAITGQFTERNLGTSTAGKSRTRIYLSADNALDASDEVIKTKKMKNLSPFGEAIITFKKNLPANVSPVGQYLIVRVDDQNQLFDTNLDNNILVFGPLF